MSASSYVIPYGVLLKQIGIAQEPLEDNKIVLTRDQLASLVRAFLVSVPVDEAWYTATYQDVEQAIQCGTAKSAKEHFVANGYFENRLPAKVLVDADFYVSTYPDVADGISDGEIASAQEHFESHGFTEGRLPFRL